MLVHSLEDLVERDPGFVALMFELFTSGRRNPEIAAEFAELQRGYAEHVARLLAAREREGAMRLSDEPEAVAAVLLALADGFALRLLGEPAMITGRPAARHRGRADVDRELELGISLIRRARRSERIAPCQNYRRSTFPRCRRGRAAAPGRGVAGATKDVYAGPPPKGLLKGVPQFATDNAFYPKQTTVRAGDRVSFQIAGFHNVLLAPKGDAPPDLFAANPGAPVTGVKDAAGVDIWFNGQPSSGSTRRSRSGGRQGLRRHAARRVRPAARAARRSRSRCKFPKKGTYKVLCSVHAGMKGTVVVKGKKAKVPSKKQDAKRIKKQKKAAAKLAKKLVDSYGVPGGATVKAGNDKKGVATIAFFPGTTTVKTGESVKFTMSNKSTEIAQRRRSRRRTTRSSSRRLPRTGRRRPDDGLPERAARTAWSSTAPATATGT